MLPSVRRLIALAVTVCLSGMVAACIKPVRMPAAGEREPDRYLFERGTESLQRHRWLDAKEYFQKIIDSYPQSQYRQEARLGIGDAQLGEGSYSSYLVAAETFREFLRFYPLNERADYAQYRLAVTQFRQMLPPQRDQTPTLDTLRELDTFVRRYPNSKYMADALALQRQARDRLSDAEASIGVHYFRRKWYSGAIPRLQGILKDDPSYTHRDEVYFYLGESYYAVARPKEALPYFDKLVTEFKASEYLQRAQVRLAELKAAGDAPPKADATPVTPPAVSTAPKPVTPTATPNVEVTR